MARPRRLRRGTRLAEYRGAHGLTQEQVAERLHITPEMVRRHEHGVSYPEEPTRRRYCALYRAGEDELGLKETTSVPMTDDVEHLVTEITESSTSNNAIELLDRGTTTLAQLHTRAPARHVLRQVRQLRTNAHALLRSPIRLSQARDVYRIESELLAHSCMLLSDLKHYGEAYRHGMAALAFATEAGSSKAIICSALAKTLRWEERLVESVDMARAGYESISPSPIRLQLGSYEANGSALLGDSARAREVLRRVEDEAPACDADAGDTVWSFPRARQAIFALSVATQSGDTDSALRAAAMADESWAGGAPLVQANWAQIRIGAATAHLDRGNFDAAAADIAPVLEMAPELRVSTVTAYTGSIARRLHDRRFHGSPIAGQLVNDLRTFALEALPDEPDEETR